MTKNDIAIMVAKATGLQQNEVKQVIQLVLDGIVEILVRDGRLELRGFGVIEVRQRRPRQGRNPMTGESVQVPSRKAIRFQAGKYMLERVNDEIEPGVPDADGSRQRLLKSLMTSLAGQDFSVPDDPENAPKLSRRRKRTGTVRRGRPPRYLIRPNAEASTDAADGMNDDGEETDSPEPRSDLPPLSASAFSAPPAATEPEQDA